MKVVRAALLKNLFSVLNPCHCVMRSDTKTDGFCGISLD